jgi:hypothetical protein
MARLGRKSLRFKRKQVRLLMDIAQPNWLSVHRNGASNVSRHRHNDRYNHSTGCMYLDYSIQHVYHQHTERYHQAHEQCQCSTAQAEHGDAMRTEKELLKIKEAFALAMLDLLDVYDELLATGRVWVAPEPTANDLLKNEEESNA